MIQVALLTEKQANSLRGVEFVKDNLFNPIQDEDGNWVISLEELDLASIEWVKELPIIEYKPIKYESLQL
jgi:hypothetical protein